MAWVVQVFSNTRRSSYDCIGQSTEKSFQNLSPFLLVALHNLQQHVELYEDVEGHSGGGEDMGGSW